MQVDIGAFDLAVNVHAKAEWLEPSDDFAVLNLRNQFQQNLDLISEKYQAMYSQAMGKAITQNQMYFQSPDLNTANMTPEEIEALKDLG